MTGCSTRLLAFVAVLGAAPVAVAQARVVPPDAAIGSFYTAPQPPPPAPVYGPLATTGTAVPGVPSTGIDPGTYLGTGASPPNPSPQNIAESAPTDPNAAIGKPRGRAQQGTAQSGRKVVVEDQPTGGRTLADCMAMWEPATHMTREDWRRTCRRTLGGVEVGYTKSKKR